ncbi:hypothetical protein EBH_0070980 [Eimeria brunetti]|uniref:Uncharacterized protein n=1 Tax=Eimeria brunetti TaxID=51314 RepID=U6LV67_9EIME|nr:hypothetical protein EBH_0070980 [Eimeria brunetti]
MLIASRLRSHEAKQRGFLLDGCGLEGVDMQRLLALLHAGPQEAATISHKHRLDHGSNCSSRSTEVPTSPVAAAEAEAPEQQQQQQQEGAAAESVDSSNREQIQDEGSEGSTERSAAAAAVSLEGGPHSEPPSPSQSSDPQQQPDPASVPASDSLLSEGPPPAPETGEEGQGPQAAAAEVIASIPPLQLGALRSASADVSGQYPLPADSGSETLSPEALSSPPAPSEETPAARPNRPQEAKVENACDLGGDETETDTLAPPLPFPRIDIVFVFEPEGEDLWREDERLLLEEEPKTPHPTTPKKRPRYPYGDGRDILETPELAEARRQFQDKALLQQVEAFRALGVRIV